MERLGRLVNTTPSMNLVVKTEKAPKIGSVVIDENLKVVGRIFDVIGAVSSPYAIVKPASKEHQLLSNRMLYLLLSKKTGAKNNEWEQ